MIDPTGLETNITEFPLPAIHDIILNIGTASIGIIGLCSGLEGYFKTDINLILSALLIGGSLFSIITGPTSDIVGLSIILTIFILNYVIFKKRQIKNTLYVLLSIENKIHYNKTQRPP